MFQTCSNMDCLEYVYSVTGCHKVCFLFIIPACLKSGYVLLRQRVLNLCSSQSQERFTLLSLRSDERNVLRDSGSSTTYGDFVICANWKQLNWLATQAVRLEWGKIKSNKLLFVYISLRPSLCLHFVTFWLNVHNSFLWRYAIAKIIKNFAPPSRASGYGLQYTAQLWVL
jgi:hypothetical protein